MSDETPDIDNLGYEAAREELRLIVQSLETGSAPLEETLSLWQRGEALATHCRRILEAAQAKIDSVSGETSEAGA